jgi:hypothetical protein
MGKIKFRWYIWVPLVISSLIVLGALAYSIYIARAYPLRSIIEATFMLQAAAAVLAIAGFIFRLANFRRAAMPAFVAAVDCFAISIILQLSSLVFF